MQPADARVDLTVDHPLPGVGSFTVSTPLTRLNYFDGQFLRAERLEREQAYFRALIALSSRGGGAGVVYGLDVERIGDGQLRLSPGLAIDGNGRPLMLPSSRTIDFDVALASSRGRFDRFQRTERPASAALGTARLYLVSALHAEEAGGGSDAAVLVEGIAVRIVPLVLRSPLATSRIVPLKESRHLRSLVASAFFRDELVAAGSLISGRGLLRPAWCSGAGRDRRLDVPLAVVARVDGRTLFVDPWIARRERHEGAPRRYWIGLMRMRPWDVFLAQVLQFQCQLNAAIGVPLPGEEDEDPCAERGVLLADVAQYLIQVERLYRKLPVSAPANALTEKSSLVVSGRTVEVASTVGAPAADLAARIGRLLSPEKLEQALVDQSSTARSMGVASLDSFILPGGATALSDLKVRALASLLEILRRPKHGLLLDRGIVELPPAGFLPVAVGEQKTVNEQARDLLGAGVDLRFCVVRPDVVAHALEEAQHLERISLLAGLDDPRRRPQVDILVPDGKRLAPLPLAGVFEAKLRVEEAESGTGSFSGVARTVTSRDGGERSFRLAAFGSAGPLLDRLAELLQGDRLSAGSWPISGTPRDDESNGDPTGSFPFLFQAIGLRVAGMPVIADHALWLDLSCDGDIRAIPVFEGAAVRGRIVLARGGAAVQAMEMTVRGKLTVLANDIVNGGSKIEATLSIALTPTAHGSNVQLVPQVRQLRLRLAYAGGDEEGALIVAVSYIQSGSAPLLEWQVSWGEPTASVSMLVASGSTEETGRFALRPVLALQLKENAAALQADHPLHVLADSALRLAQEAQVSEGSFRRIAEKHLFAATEPEEALIEATRGWVLFHRRRTWNPVAISRPRVLRRRYRVFDLMLADEQDLRTVLTQLESDDDEVQAALRARIMASDAPKLIVEFAGDRLVTSAATITEARPGENAGARLECIIVAGDEDSEAGIEIQSAKRLAEVLGVRGSADAAAAYIVLPKCPAALISFNAEGAMLVISRIVNEPG